jgi:hypothetical protein
MAAHRLAHGRRTGQSLFGPGGPGPCVLRDARGQVSEILVSDEDLKGMALISGPTVVLDRLELDLQ